MPKNNPQDWKEKCWCFSLCRVFQWRVRDVRSQWNLICNIDVRFFTFQAFLLAACLWQNLFWPVGLLFSFGLGMSAFCGVFVKKTVFRNKVRHSNISRPCFCLMCRQRSREIACACRIPYRLAYTQPITSDYIPEFSLLSYCCLQPKRAFTQKLIWHLTMWMS